MSIVFLNGVNFDSWLPLNVGLQFSWYLQSRLMEQMWVQIGERGPIITGMSPV